MPRPCKWRFIRFSPNYPTFKPCGIPISSLEEISLTLDELEAIRLKDYEELYQEEAAEKMKISRQTFGNILNSARAKIADFLINGKHLKIEGGTIMSEKRIFKCYDCGYEWSVPFGEERPQECPKCNSVNLQRIQKEIYQENAVPNAIGLGRRMGKGRGGGGGRGRCGRGGSQMGRRGR
ncbi:MAG: DUF134 domain-containing protein [Thermoanaerobaculaceae bacterium]|nr:DUF134 domain-containing protein [Thermoanaerobaculaceae bacterium]